MGKNRVIYGDRAFNQDAQAAMKSDIVRALIELITNADDAYGPTAGGKIRVEVEHRRKSPWKVIVRDRATGMRMDKMRKVFGQLGGRTSGFESGHAVRGNLGRGAKDVAAFGPVTFESICENYYSEMVLETDGTYDDPVERRVTDEDRKRLGIPRGSGTVVTITVDSRFTCPQHGTLVDKLSRHYQLRDINSDPRRELTLVDLNSGDSEAIRYGLPSLVEEVACDVAVPGYDAVASLRIWRLPERAENASNDPLRPEGILIKGNRAVYENTLFSFESNIHGHWFTGSLTCPMIDELARSYDDRESRDQQHTAENPTPIITRTRDGLEHEHPFYKSLVECVEPHLARLVKAEEKKAKETPANESARLRKAFDSLGRDLAQLVDADLREVDEDGLGGGPGSGGSEPIRIIPENPVLYIGEDKTLSVVVMKSVGANEFSVEVDPEGVVQILDTNPFELRQHPRRDDCLIGQIHIRPLIEDEETYLTVTCGESEAVTTVYVRPERETPDPVPPSTLEFAKKRYQLAHMRRRNLVLRAPTEIINRAGSSRARVTSSDQGVVVLGADVELDFDEEQLCFVGRVMVDPRVLGANAILTASLGDEVATCEVAVREREGGGPSLQIRIVDEVAGRYRAYMDRADDVTVIKILGGHPAIRRYIGPGPDFPNQDDPAARSVIAEIIAEQAARLVMEKKHKTAGELDGAAFYADHFFYLDKYLVRCHKDLVGDVGNGAARTADRAI
ncbi:MULTISPECIES: ATP-binding protein [unclassified Mycobacterium]|uniref:ATP-binding protein n=1 Tax=unclassified Mycobacterium TaxID=2642494 RepID=UPI00080107EA|nr:MULTISPECIES: ATP-binding protein [unclassified Mycobacterium]OBG55773.1 hypothetical protein A5703_07435 [Mycobacterium sp. E188]OBH41091.1 hypothetical protein A5691_19390 [Mycobacterium sp. E183]